MEMDFHDYAIDRVWQIPTKSVKIGNNVWIGCNAIILKCVKIGYGTVVAAGSVVTRDVSRQILVVGNPVKVIKQKITWYNKELVQNN